MVYRTVRPLLYRLEPERAHHLVMTGLAVASRNVGALAALSALYALRDPRLEVHAFGLAFPNPLGLAAGLDKDAIAVPALAALGFGSIEVGSVTALAQLGNPSPRLFRLVEDEALVNRMGFNNAGADALARRLAAWRERGPLPPIGVNVGKSRVAPIEAAIDDYDASLRAVWDVADYLVLNVSSPNTPDLRSLQDREPLTALLRHARGLQETLGPRPLLLKIAPDLSDAALEEVASVATDEGVTGLIATNTSVERPDLVSRRASEPGGLSGRPLARRSLEVLRVLRASTHLPIVSVGGVFDAEDAILRLEAGADLLQLYTAMIYLGPGVVKPILRGVLDELARRGCAHVSDLRRG
ncbi:MAG: quinone-dependent dihydroorotate dehydrogenase [Trueperaceae bacterium]